MSKNGRKHLLCQNPATLETIAEIPTISSLDEVSAVVEKARKAQKKWAKLTPTERIPYFRKMKQYVQKNIDAICRDITLDNGKTLVESLSAEVLPVLDMLNFCMKDVPHALQDERLSNPMFKLARIRSRIIFEPLGVVAIIAPWNFPFCIPATQTLMAVATGNAVVLKPAALTAHTGRLIGNIFEASGFPEGLVNVIQGSGGVLGDAILAAGVDRIAFTGSVPVGKKLMANAAPTLTPITLDLGGKDPFIVCEDADIERAASGAVWGSFVNAGQVCASVERVYVNKKVAKEFIKLVKEKTDKLRVGNGLDFGVDMGPLIDDGQVQTVKAHVEEAVAKGAKVLSGGHEVTELPGHFFRPTVLVDVDHTMECMVEETFGPTMPVMVVANDDEAIELANDSKFALTASVWSKSTSHAEGIAKRIVTGTATVNDCEFTYGFAQCPWGGPKESGIGRTHSIHGLLEFTNLKNLTVTTPMMRNNIWWYPYSENKYRGIKALTNTLYNDSLLNKCSGMSDFLKITK